MWYFTNGQSWRWLLPNEFVTARKARSEGEYRQYGEGQLFRLTSEGLPIPPKLGRPKKTTWADLLYEEYGEASGVTAKAPGNKKKAAAPAKKSPPAKAWQPPGRGDGNKQLHKRPPPTQKGPPIAKKNQKHKAPPAAILEALAKGSLTIKTRSE